MTPTLRYHPAPRSAYAAPQDFSGLRERTHYLIHRAYQNIYGLTMPADENYQQTLFNAALQLIQDPRASNLSEKILLKAFEDIIRISDEHTREARKHLSRASNPVYLRETALDNALEQQNYLQALDTLTPPSEVRALKTEHTGRLYRHGTMQRAEVVEIAYQNLMTTLVNAS